MKKYIIAIIIIIALTFSFLIGYNTKSISYDLNSDGVVDIVDMSILLSNFTN